MNRVFDLNGRLHQTHRNILISNDQSVGDPDGLHEVLEEGTTVIAGYACSYDLMFYEKLLPTFQAGQALPTFLRQYLHTDTAQSYAHAATPSPLS